MPSGQIFGLEGQVFAVVAWRIDLWPSVFQQTLHLDNPRHLVADASGFSHLLYKLQAKVSRSTFWAVMTRLLSQTSERFCMREQSKGKLNWKWKTSTIWNWCTDACKFTQFHTAWFVPTCHWAGQIQAPYATEECQDWKICSLTCKRNWGSSYNVSNWNNLQLLPLRAHQEAKNC